MGETIGVVCLVKDSLREFVLEHWKMVEEKFASKGVQSFAHPNLSFQGGITDDIDRIEYSISQLSLRIAIQLIKQAKPGCWEIAGSWKCRGT